MKTTNIKEVKTKSIFFFGIDFKTTGFDRITMPKWAISKVLVTYDDEKKPVEVFSLDGDDAEKNIRDINQFMDDNGLRPFWTDSDSIAFKYLEERKYILRKSHDAMDRENRELKEKIVELEDKIAKSEEKIAGLKSRLTVYSEKYGSDGPLGKPFQLKPNGKPRFAELYDPEEEGV